jgi:hypothetical protein
MQARPAGSTHPRAATTDSRGLAPVNPRAPACGRARATHTSRRSSAHYRSSTAGVAVWPMANGEPGRGCPKRAWLLLRAQSGHDARATAKGVEEQRWLDAGGHADARCPARRWSCPIAATRAAWLTLVVTAVSPREQPAPARGGLQPMSGAARHDCSIHPAVGSVPDRTVRKRDCDSVKVRGASSRKGRVARV